MNLDEQHNASMAFFWFLVLIAMIVAVFLFGDA